MEAAPHKGDPLFLSKLWKYYVPSNVIDNLSAIIPLESHLCELKLFLVLIDAEEVELNEESRMCREARERFRYSTE